MGFIVKYDHIIQEIRNVFNQITQSRVFENEEGVRNLLNAQRKLINCDHKSYKCQFTKSNSWYTFSKTRGILAVNFNLAHV